MSNAFSRLIALTAFLVISPAALAQTTIFVDANLASGLNDGTSWADAHQGTGGLKVALAAAVAGDQIFAAEGRYKTSSNPGRAASFVLKNGVEVYGSFLGTEAAPSERPPFGTAPSVLDGDINDDDGSGILTENSYHVVKGASTNASAVLDGFDVIGGNSNGSTNADRGGGILCLNASPTIRNCRFIGNRCTFGGGAGYINGGAPSFTNTTFQDNIGGAFGGAFDIATAGSVRFDRCSFIGNRAARAGALEIFSTTGVLVTNSVFDGNVATGSSGGGAIWVGSGGSTSFHNITVVGNSATSQTVGGLRNQGSNVTVSNSIFWANTGSGGAMAAANQVTASVGVTYSLVMGGFAGAGNLQGDPEFQDMAGSDFSLTLGSPCIDSGNNATVPAGVVLDLGGGARFSDEALVADSGAGAAPIVDMGADEFDGAQCIGVNYCGAVVNSSGLPGVICAWGSDMVADNDLSLTARNLAPNQFGYFVVSQSTGFIANPGGSTGNLCIGSPFGRFNGLIASSGAAGALQIDVDMTNLPLLGPLTAGSYHFQAWFRDTGSTSNFTDGTSVLFQ